MKISVLTVGCKINQFFSDCVKEKHIRKGDKIVPLSGEPDIVYVNTCSVTEHAGHESRKLFRKSKRNASVVKIMGCHGKLFPEEFVNSQFVEEDRFISYYKNPHQNRSRAYLPIQTGCNNFCTYCIVPYARGKEYSVSSDIIEENLKKRIRSGYKEIIITGIHIGSYRYKEENLYSLLKRLLKYNVRIRLSSIKPDSLDMKFITLFKNKNLMPHIHISQQSGDNNILKRMGRKYYSNKILWIVDKLRNIREDMRIAGDFIVGFPGERKKEFMNTVDLIHKVKFSHLHVFRYTKRPYTLAAKYPENVDEKEKKRRSKILIDISNKLREEYIKERIGRVYNVIYENKSSLGDNYACGFSPNYIKIHFLKNGKKEKIFPVEIKKFKENFVYGEIR